MGFADLPLRREDAFGPEQSVIGSMLIDKTVVGLVVSKLSEGDFAMEINRRLFLAFRSLYLDNRVIDPVTVLDLAAPGETSVRRYMLDLMDLTPTAANIEEYIAGTRRITQKLQLRAIGKQLQELENPEDALPLLRKGEELLAEQGRDDEADMAKSLLDFYADLERVPQYLKWGFPFLDAELYAERQDFVILAGRPSDGKTALALHMAYTQAAECNVGFFSLETGRKRLFSRLVSSVSGVAGAAIKKRNLSEMEYDLIAGSTDSITKHNLHVVEASRWTVEQIEARTMARKFDVIYIDYLQLISSSVRGRSSRAEEVADISRSLANMARTHGIMVVALSQLSRPNEKGERREPVMSDLRESGQIEQDADEIMFIWRKDETSSDAERILTLAKNKEGRLGTWPLTFRGELQRFIPELSGYEKPVAKPKRREPEYKQATLYNLPSGEPLTWEELTHGQSNGQDAPHSGGGSSAAPGPGQGGPGTGDTSHGNRPGTGDGQNAATTNLPF